VTIYTIGFTKKSAKEFFGALRRSGAKQLLDIRLHNTSQLAGFTKREDLHYFLDAILGMAYTEVPLLAPDDALLKGYRKNKDWPEFEAGYLRLIKEREVERHLDLALFSQGAVLLCSEAKPDKCHRRLAAEYLANSALPGAAIRHL